jgi:hypothetical protein
MARIDGSSRGVLITEEAARRIARGLQKLEQGNRAVDGRKLRVGYDEGTDVQICKTTAEWPKGTTAQLQIIYANDCDNEGASGETVEAHNISYDVAADAKVVIALATNGCWYMVEAGNDCDEESEGSGDCGCTSLAGQDLKQLPGYDASKTQILGHERGCLKWLDTVDCEEQEEEEPEEPEEPEE